MRNKIILFSILAFIIFSVSVGLVVTSVSAEQEVNLWPMFHHDQQHTGHSPYIGPITPSLRTGWPYTTGGRVGSSPAVGLDGTIYIGSEDQRLYAINPDGNLKWSYPMPSTLDIISSSPAIYLGGPYPVIYIATQAGWGGGTNTNFYAIEDRQTNPNLGWSLSLDHSFEFTSPVIGNDGTIYIGNLKDATVYAINPGGTIKWSIPLCSSEFILASPVWRPWPGSDGRIYVGTTDHNLYAIQDNGPGSPVLKWSCPTGSDIASSAAIKDDVIYVGSADGRLHAIRDDGNTYTLLWTYPATGDPRLPSDIISSPAIGSDGAIYFGSGNPPLLQLTGKLYAVNPSGTLRWEYQPLLPAVSAIVSSPAIGSDGVIYFGCADGRVYAVDSSGTLKWNYPLAPFVWGTIGSSPAIGFRGDLYVGSNDNNVYAITGREDVFIRDCDDDDGRIPSWDANHNGRFDGRPPDRTDWTSPDIWVDNYLDGNFDGLPDAHPEAGEVNHLWAKVTNIGSGTATNIEVHFYWGKPAIGMSWPGDWYQTDISPTYLTIPSLPPGGEWSGYVEWKPVTLPQHQCSWVRLLCDTDTIVSNDHPWENNIGMKNFWVENLRLSDGLYVVTMDFGVKNPDRVVEDVFLDLYLEDWLYNWTVELTSDDTRFYPLLDHPVIGYVNKYVFSNMDAGEEGDVTLNVIAPAGTENNTGTVHIAGTIDNRPIGGISVQVVPPIRKIIDETEYKDSITQPIDVSRIRFVHNAVNEKWVKGSKWPIPMELMYWQKSTKYLIEIDVDGNGNVTRVGFRRWGNPITEIPYDLAEQSLASLPPGFVICP